uniref:Ribsomal protein L6 n=1 Tax=Balamuthia mandrillaris TaxID=66527 RepID=A0A0K1HNR3_9EUKA|nr:ribsomal protein L6 [Balamuthia mandrillaris]AKT93805.1 ribsomal protein L6 [Balamuthia mandrillaris]
MLVNSAIISNLKYDPFSKSVVGPNAWSASIAISSHSSQRIVSWLQYFLHDQEFPSFLDSLKTGSLGLKMFIRENELFIDLGYSHFCLFRLPKQQSVKCRKKKIYFKTVVEQYRSLFTVFNRVKVNSVYKSKGLAFSNRIKYMRFRVGKKQQI